MNYKIVPHKWLLSGSIVAFISGFVLTAGMQETAVSVLLIGLSLLAFSVVFGRFVKDTEGN